MSTNLPPLPAPVAGSARCVVPAAASVGEGTLWSMREQALYWVDILGCMLHRFDPATGRTAQWTFAEEVSAVAERASEPGLIITLRRGFALFDPATGGEPRYLHQPEAALPGNRFNDGKCDAQGRFWGGTMDIACEAPTGALYRYDADGRCTQHESGFAVTNGPTWSADGRSDLFFNDTVKGRVHAYDFDEEGGTLSNKRTWLRLARGDGVPDGMTTDAAGRIWIAHWGGACVSCHDPLTARELCRVELPTSNVTNCTFGGADLRTLFITTARTGLTPQQLEAQPLAGGLFSVTIDSPGLPSNLFRG